MARHVHLRVALDGGRRPANGVLAGAILLRVRGITVLDWRRAALEGSALAFARAGTADHRGVADVEGARAAEWPLVLGATSVTDRGGEIADWSVTHAGDSVFLSNFFGCAVAPTARFEVPWAAWAAAIIRLGDLVVRRTRSAPPGLSAEEVERREGWRAELRDRLRAIRARARTLRRAAGAPR